MDIDVRFMLATCILMFAVAYTSLAIMPGAVQQTHGATIEPPVPASQSWTAFGDGAFHREHWNRAMLSGQLDSLSVRSGDSAPASNDLLDTLVDG